MCRFSRKSGRTLSMLGRLPVLPRKRSTMASFSWSAAKWLWKTVRMHRGVNDERAVRGEHVLPRETGALPVEVVGGFGLK